MYKDTFLTKTYSMKIFSSIILLISNFIFSKDSEYEEDYIDF